MYPLDHNTDSRVRRRAMSKGSSIDSSTLTPNLDISKKLNTSRSNSDSGSRSIWDDIRDHASSEESEDEFEHSELKEERRQLKEETKKRNKKIIMRLPAGIDTGKYIEEALKRSKNEGLGPRRIPNPNLVSTTNLNVSTQSTAYGRSYGNSHNSSYSDGW